MTRRAAAKAAAKKIQRNLKLLDCPSSISLTQTNVTQLDSTEYKVYNDDANQRSSEKHPHHHRDPSIDKKEAERAEHRRRRLARDVHSERVMRMSKTLNYRMSCLDKTPEMSTIKAECLAFSDAKIVEVRIVTNRPTPIEHSSDHLGASNEHS